MNIFCPSSTEMVLRHAGEKKQIIDVAAGRKRADLVLKNAAYVNVFTEQICRGGYCHLRRLYRRDRNLCRSEGDGFDRENSASRFH